MTPGGRVRLYCTFKGAVSFSFFLYFLLGMVLEDPVGWVGKAAWQSGISRLLRGPSTLCFTGCKLSPTPICITQVLIVGGLRGISAWAGRVKEWGGGGEPEALGDHRALETWRAPLRGQVRARICVSEAGCVPAWVGACVCVCVSAHACV